MHSQTTFKAEPRIHLVVNAKGDTAIQMNLADAKIVLDDLLDKQYTDSLIAVYKVRDSINASTISLQLSEIRDLQSKSKNQDLIVGNLNTIIANNAKEIADLNNIIKKQKKEIRKQKVLKILGFTASVVLPVTLVILLKH